MSGTLNCQLTTCQGALQPSVDQLTVDGGQSFAMQDTRSMAHRICEIVGKDSLRKIADKLALRDEVESARQAGMIHPAQLQTGERRQEDHGEKA